MKISCNACFEDIDADVYESHHAECCKDVLRKFRESGARLREGHECEDFITWFKDMQEAKTNDS